MNIKQANKYPIMISQKIKEIREEQVQTPQFVIEVWLIAYTLVLSVTT